MAVNVHGGAHDPYALVARLTNVINGHDQPSECPHVRRLAALGHIEHDGEGWVATDRGQALYAQITAQPVA